MARSDFRFTHTLRVRWSEVDKQDIVFNGHYLTYFDVGVTEYYRTIDMPYPDAIVSEGADLYAKKAEIEISLKRKKRKKAKTSEFFSLEKPKNGGNRQVVQNENSSEMKK